MKFKTFADEYASILESETEVEDKLRKILNLNDKIKKAKKSFDAQKIKVDSKIKDCEETTKIIAKALSLGKYDVKPEQGKSPEVQAQRI